MEKWKKHFSSLLSSMMLFTTVSQAAIPVAVYAESNTDAPPVEEVEEVAPLQEIAQVLSVSDLIALNNSGEIVTTTGYIVGYVISNTNITKDPAVIGQQTNGNTNLAIAADPDETNPANMVFVQLPAGSLRDEFGLLSNPNIIGEEILVTGLNTAYFGHHGIRPASEIEFVSETGEPEVPVELELVTIREARDQATGNVRTKGVVTARLRNTIQIQDGTAAIAVRPTSLDVSVGDEITVEGNLQSYRGLLQLDGATLIENTGTTDVPTPKALTAAELPNHQSELAVMTNITITAVNDNNYTAVDEAGTEFVVRDENNALSIEVGEKYDSITGIISQFDSTHQVIPRSASDLIADQSVVQRVFASPEAGLVQSGTEITLTTQTEGAAIYYTLDGSTPTTESSLYEGPIVIEEETTVSAIAVVDGLDPSEVSTFAYTVYNDDIRIHHIQGAGHRSPMAGAFVNNIEGIVTYTYDINGSHYFHMQTPEENYDDDPKTSEGIVIYTGQKTNVKVGDLVEVTGTVDEYYIDGYNDKNTTDLPVTQINARNDRSGVINIVEENVELPAPIKITSSEIPGVINGPEGFESFEPESYSMDFWESIEGMRVEIAPSRAVAPQQHGDLVVVTNEYEPENKTINGGIRVTEDGPDSRSIQFKVQPNGPARDLKVKTSDSFKYALTGVVNYGFGNYKVYADLADIEEAHVEGPLVPKATTIVEDENKLTVATYNVENFSANTSYTSNDKAQRIAESFVNEMKSPDIVGIVEVMANNATSSTSPEAAESYQRLINEIVAAGGPEYDFLNIDPVFNQDGGAPGGNIRVGYLYNPERVSLMDGEAGGPTEAVDYVDGQLTLNPGRIAPNVDAHKSTRKPLAAQFEFQGESVVMINNHFNSKTGDQSNYGQTQPPVMGSRAQRNEIARIQNEFIKGILADNPDENIVVMGDLNDFEFSPPVEVLKGEELVNLIDSVPAEERYNYNYQGSSQILDHILVSNNLADLAIVDIININSDFTNMHGRASDHDPILAQIDLGVSEDPEDSDELIVELERRIEELEASLSELEEENEELDKQITSLRALVASLRADLEKQNKELEELEKRMEELEKKLAELEESANFELSIMHMNDTHSRVEKLPQMVTAVNSYRAKNEDALLFHAGDVFSGTLYFNEFLGQADLALMNLMNFDAMVFGNHEFDLGTADKGHTELADFVSKANFPFLGTNVDFSRDAAMSPLETNTSLVNAPNNGEIYDSLVFEIDGEEVGVFGLVTEDTENIASPRDVQFEDYVAAAERAVAEFEDAGINKIVALTHLGYDSAPEIGNDLQLANKVEGIDIIVGGHSHTLIEPPVLVNEDSVPTVIVQAGQYADNLGTLSVEFNADGEVVEFDGELLPVGDYEADPQAVEIFTPYEEAVEGVKSELIGAVAQKDLLNPRHSDFAEGEERVSVRANETELGNLITDAMLAKAKETFPETVIALQNAGGIRAPIDEGPITTGEVIEVLPFGNDPVVVRLTGQEIADVLEYGARQAPAENGGFLHVAGMRYYYDSTREAGDRVRGMYLVDGEELTEIQLDQEYLVTTNNFTGQGGDGFETFAIAYEEGRVRDIGEIDWQNLRDYMVEEQYLNGIVDPVLEGRIVDLMGEDLPFDTEGYELSIMHMNDTHSRVEKLPQMVTAVNSYRVENEDALLFHAGDVFSGTLYFNAFEGLADLALMNLMNFDAMVFGNHEFDLGSDDLGHTELAEFVSNANFPFLGTNLDFSRDAAMSPLETNDSLVKEPNKGEIYESLVFEIDGEEIGVFGLTTEDTVDIASPRDVQFEDFVAAAERAVVEFEEAGINKIVALTHLGYDSAPEVGNDIRLANEVEGIDIIVGGHSHTVIEPPVLVNEDSVPTVIVQAGQYADNLGTLTVEFNDEGEIIDFAGELLDVGEFEADAEALEVLAPYAAEVEEMANELIGAIAMKDLLNPRFSDFTEGEDKISVRANETELGNLITDAMLAKAKETFPETVISLQNAGGIRAPIDEGPITTGEVIEVLPFGNDPVVVRLTGQEIADVLEHGVRQAPAENGGFLHVSGMRYYYDSTREAGDRIRGMYLVDGEELTEIQLDQEYLITTNNFTGQGGDGFETFAIAYEEGRVRDIGEIDWQNLRDYMVEDRYLGGTVDPVLEGRIVDLMGEDLPIIPDEPTDPAEEIAELERRIEELEKQLSELEAGNEALQADLNALRDLLASLRADLEAGETALTALLERLAALEARLAALEASLDDAKDEGEETPDQTDPTDPGDSTDSGSTDQSGSDTTNGTGTPSERVDENGKPLPAAGTNMDNVVIIGLVVLSLGAFLFVISKRKTS